MNEIDYNIQEASILDLETIYTLTNLLENTTFSLNNFRTIYAQLLQSPFDYIYILKYQNKAIGYIHFNVVPQLHHSDIVSEIFELVIDNDYRKLGFGKVLLDYAVQTARNLNATQIELVSSFPRERAHAFYEKNGFEKTSYKMIMKL